MCLYIFACLNCIFMKCYKVKMGYAVVVLLVFLLCHEVSSVSILPHKHQTISLLKFKQSFTIDTLAPGCFHPKTSSWNTSRDCCSWDGVVCDEMTGHVIELDLGCSGLVGKIDSNSSLFQLSHLQRIDLSSNYFSNSHIPPEFGRFSSLTHLDLSDSYFSGQIPSEISHLSKLHSLYLFNFFELTTKLRFAAHDFKLLLQNLTQLRELYLIGINISSTIPLNFSSHFATLALGDNGLYGMIPESIFQLPNLEMLGLFNNEFSGYFPKIKRNNSASIKELFLSGMNFSDNILEPIGNLTSLQALFLRNCSLRGPIPEFLSNLTRIETLGLSFNSLNGTIPSWIFSLPSLALLFLGDNQFSGQIEDLKSNSLHTIDLSNNQLQGHLPNSIQDLVNLSLLNLSFNNFSGSVDSIPLQSLITIDLRSNFLQGSLPIPPISTKYFFISHNNLTEEIPTSICNLTSLVMLDFSRNNLRGEIPQCLGNITALQVLDMSHNNLSGNIPATFRNGSSLSSLNFHGNKLEGKIPQSLTNCKQLEVVDLGDNHLNDTFPMWLGTLPKLKVLSLRSNKLHGSIGTLTTQNLFPQLRILDLSSNAFTKNLPTSLFQQLKVMRTINQTMTASSDRRGRYYEDSVVVVSKGFEREIVRILFLYTTIDLSNNKFEGHIPAIMGDLIALRVLNISHNRLEGPIPPSLGSLPLVESLDLSSNHLVGEIPAEFASLTFLEVLNLSYNYLEGCIPQGNQLQTIESNSYEGNNGLRGFLISKGCGNDHVSGKNDAISGQLNDEEDFEFWSDFWKAALMGYGSGLCIGLSIIYFMISSGKSIWLARIIVVLEHKLMMGRRKKQQRQRNYRRRSNKF